jgi:ADP-ribosyl-[dinitrogen reductase] hydrolase
MGFFSFWHRNRQTVQSSTSAMMMMGSSSAISSPTMEKDALLQRVISAALWSYFAGDALSAPTHWFYGGYRQVQQYYGPQGIRDYFKPVYNLQGSILNKSNLSGGGRSGASSSADQTTIIGHVINHGKQDLWDPSQSIHYHATLQAGENTLEADIARVLMKSIVETEGKFDADHFRKAYVTFMTTPGSHNDTYASTCHRMFFANWYYRKLDPVDCPDNDKHNVDTIDGLVLPTITALAVAGHPDGTLEQASEQAASTVTVTRNSRVLQQYARAWGALVFRTVRAAAETPPSAGASTRTAVYAKDMAKALGLRTPQARSTNEITACYLDSAVPAMLDTVVKYMPSETQSVWDALLENANTGGENVHRGSCLGAIWGAAAASSPSTVIEPKLINGLYHREALHQEIQEFLDAIHRKAEATATTSKSEK